MPAQNSTTNESLYGKGVCKTKAGHLRYTSPAELRHKYVHRVQIERQLAETPYYVLQLLPWPYEVHHIDYNKEHNGPENLMILSEAFHAALTAHRPRGPRGKWGRKFQPKWQPPPDWVLFQDDSEGVPF